MNSKLLNFHGLMAPTFTPFTTENEVNYDLIEPYARFLKMKGINAILINGTSGEGMSLSLIERKKVTEKWVEVCRKSDILIMVQISGCSFVDASELAQHSSTLDVDAVLCLPELYFKPKTVQELVEYLKNLSVQCPRIPLYYYHIPMFTQVNLPMERFMELAAREIPNFAGIKYTSGDLEKGMSCLKYGQVWLGSDTILSGALALGFNNAIMTSLNIKPEISLEIISLMKQGKVEEARKQQLELNRFVETALENGNGEWVTSMKSAFNNEFGKQLNLGFARKPL